MAMYIGYINFKKYDNLSCAVNNVLESIAIELNIANDRPIIVWCFYRQPDSKISQSVDVIEDLY